MHYKTIVFDLDETLYPKNSGVMAAIRERICQFGTRLTGLPPAEVTALCQTYLDQYGTALGGLQRHYNVDLETYLAFVHDLPLNNYLQPDPGLAAMLGRLPQNKLIFTNSPAEHAGRILAALGIATYFDDIVDVRVCQFVPKPAALPYDCLLERLPHSPQATLFVDDRAVNLAPAAERGITTVWLTADNTVPPGVDYCIRNILELEQIACL